MNVKAIAKSLYGLFGAIFLIAGATVLLLHTGLLPDGVKQVITDVARGEPHTLHIIQEFGSLLIFAGLIAFWFIRHYEQSRAFHWALTTFWALFALVHWFGASGLSESVIGPMINTIPFVLFVLVGLLRKNAERRVA